MKKELVEIDIEDVKLKDPIREDVGDLSMLTTSISKMGILVPILIDRDNVLIAGARRMEACRRAGVKLLPATRLDIGYDSMTALEIQVDVNLCRQPLTNSEVEKLISKKRQVADKAGSADKGMLSRVKNLFSND